MGTALGVCDPEPVPEAQPGAAGDPEPREQGAWAV